MNKKFNKGDMVEHMGKDWIVTGVSRTRRSTPANGHLYYTMRGVNEGNYRKLAVVRSDRLMSN